MTRYGAFFTLCCALLLFPATVPAGDAPVFDLEAVGTIEVGPDGAVQDYSLETELDPDVAALVDRTVRGWRFEPVLVDGQPVIAVTRMRLELEALPRGDDYALRVADVSLGSPDPGHIPPPAYPRSARDEGLGAKVTMLLKVGADGRVQDVHVEQVSLDKRMGRRSELYRQRFADSTRETALGWSYDMGELIDGEPVAARFRVSVEFGGRRGDGWSERQAYIPGPYHPSPWGDQRQGDARDEMPAQGEMQALDTRVKLSEDVVGTML